MDTTLFTRKALALAALGAAVFAFAAAEANAAYTAQVANGTLELTGDAASDQLVLLSAGTDIAIDVGLDGTIDFTFDRSTFTAIAVEAGRGNDEVRTVGSFADELLTIDGGPGDDTLFGSNGPDTLIGGGGNDLVDGQQSADTALLGGGNDRFQWDPGDGSDTVEGQGGTDTLDFNGNGAGEIYEAAANGERLRFTRNVANVIMDLGDIEVLAPHPLGGADQVIVDDLAGTDLRTIDVDLAAFGGAGDAQADTVTVRGTAGADNVALGSSAGLPLVSGLAAQVRVAGGEEASDNVDVELLGGSDTATAAIGIAGTTPLNVIGGGDVDTVRYSGTSGADTIALVSNGDQAAVVAEATARVDTAVENLVVLGLGGPDTISGTGNLAALAAITMDGGPGDDTLLGGNGADLLLGGGGNDTVDGQQGTDTAQLGSGNDRYRWDPGDGNDTLEGQGGTDALDFNGSNIGEIYEATVNGDRVRFTRNIANVTMDLDDIEVLAPHPFGGADQVIVNDLAGTDAKTVDVDLAAFGGAGDAQADTVTVRGTSANDAVTVGSSTGAPVVLGLGAQVRVSGGEEANDNVDVETLAGADTITAAIGIAGVTPINAIGGDDVDTVRYSGTSGADTIALVSNGDQAAVVADATARIDTAVENLVVLGLGGPDTISGTGNLAALAAITIDGGGGDDMLFGSNGPDTLIGGGGNDSVDGQQGADTALLGSGNDRFQWDPGDGNDTVEGQGGNDTLDFNGSNIGEIYEATANGDRARFTRNIGNVLLDLDDVETVNARPLGGADQVIVNDLRGTDLRTVDVDLDTAVGGGDGQVDTVVVNGTDGPDSVRVTTDGPQVLANGLFARTRIAGSEPDVDQLWVQTLDGDDTVTVAPAVATLIVPVVDLGAGE